MEFEMIGFYDGVSYHCFRDLSDFFDHVFRDQYHGWRIFAHFGGRFDINFLFDYLRAKMPSTAFTFYCSGSAVISFTVRIGARWWRFCDSFRLLPRSLETLCNEFDVEHKKLPFAPLDWKYNMHDCMGLYEVLDQFFRAYDLCSETIASHALRVWRTHFMRRSIPLIDRRAEEFIRAGYYGGRCEIYRFDEAMVNKYDVNSLYPYAMMGSIPIEYISHTKRIPDDDTEIGFYRAAIDYPENYLPALPFRSERLFFPTGKIEGVYTSMEIRQAVCDGAAISIKDGIIFHAEPIFSEYISELHRAKQQAEKEGNAGTRYVNKILMNSTYGKFGQRRVRKAYGLDPGTIYMNSEPGRPKVWPIGETGIVWFETDSQSKHILPHISAAITARARLIQLQFLRGPDRIWYTDTDSLFTDADIPAGPELGQMKFEGRGSFRAWQLKEYRFDGKFSLKGVPMTMVDENGEKIRDERLARAYNDGWELRMKRPAGLLESIRAGKKAARLVDVRRARRRPAEKRARSGDNETRPWTVAEILAGFPND